MANFPKQPPSIGRSQALTGATGPSGASLPSGWLDVKAFGGAVGDGTTDDTTAIQATINAVHAAGGGTVYFPAGTYVTSSALSLDQMFGMRLEGAGPVLQYQQGVSKIRFTGSTGHLLTMYSTVNCEIYGLDFYYNNAAYAGDLIDMDGNVHFADVQNIHIHHCGSKAETSATARSIIRTNKIVIATIELCHWTGATNSLRIGDPGGSYTNVLQIEKCCFNFNTDAHILIGSADCETLTIRDCTFEAGTSTTAIRGATVANDGAQNQCYSPIIEYNWFGDASGATTWIKDVSTQSQIYAGLIQGNRFASAVVGGTHLGLRGKWNVFSNSFENGTVYDSTDPTHVALVAIGNLYNNTTATFNATSFPSGQPTTYYASLGNTSADVLPAVTRQLGVGVQSGFTYTLAIADANNLVSMNRGGATVAVTIPLNATTAFPVGTIIRVVQNGTSSVGTITVSPTGGVTLIAGDGTLISAGGTGVLVKLATDTWVLYGNVEYAPSATINGTTAGTAIPVTVNQSPNYKKVVVALNGYENTTVTAQTFTYSTAFGAMAAITHDDSAGATTTKTVLTFPASMGATKTGVIVIEGQ